MLDTHPRVVMVSGASRGLGCHIVQRLLQAGFTVSAGVRNPSALAGTERLHIFHYDAEQNGSGEEWVAQTAAGLGRIDALINCAGINPRVRVLDEGEEALDSMWRINVKGPLRLSRAALPFLIAAGNGRVINVASLAGRRVGSNVGYAMTKFAVVAFTHGIRQECWDSGVRATALCPGYIATDMTAGETEITREEMTQPADLAEMVELLLRLPNTLSIAELLVNCRKEAML
ncbi:short-chain dehydrogenase [Brenneria goodwinii]|uniref:Short-chain dehydrogenase n=1 Tax=Brenneria goodwinii TaxID=1109412 RepID=A0AAE8ENY9_9GAMM|nr:SDR family NAD(P)-dependent oxidoreductase [Brenneria goodwinii]ATA23485.1 short-chain dehydrogenase [Brenneria goodwinii]MCG8154827.1 SDR family NAD(P)-dependent oxidoreductase [Brenneria goodwinii]MCG8159836.1 SDR family NAD(P)-dependent oxidoreductase [Brenneria goodwinii]MCG8164065.1 SDR family NAD(P)-dependent oxidoreductase [Brenneria goodwinii]MCG8168674.1 SDR family NAD(P)-dependent oxidoreductase [Brenneria goodwinii]